MNKNICSKPNIAVVGAGYWGKNLIRNFSELGVLCGVCDLNKKSAAEFASKYNTKVLEWDFILKSKDIDAVIIATPAYTHAKMAIDVLLAKKHVFVEKPLALNIEDVLTLCELSESLNLRLMVGHLMQYHPIYIHLKQMLMKGALGKLQYVYSTRLNLGRVLNNKDVMLSFAPHDISMILGIVEAGLIYNNQGHFNISDLTPLNVTGFGGDYLNESIADITNVQMEFKNNIKAHNFISWLSPYKEQKLVVIGSAAIAEFDNNRQWDKKLKIMQHNPELLKTGCYPCSSTEEYIVVNEDEPLKMECKHFIESIQNGTAPKTDARESERVLGVLLNAKKTLYNKSNNSVLYDNNLNIMHDDLKLELEEENLELNLELTE